MSTEFLSDLPDVLWYAILECLAPPTSRANVLCHKLAPVCKAMRNSIDNNRSVLWSTVLHEEYGLSTHREMTSRRASKRLRRTPKEEVRDAHKLLCDRTEIGHYALTEMAHSKKTSLSLKRLRWIFQEYGPVLRVNHQSSVGGTFLVECCRARYVSEGVILRCVKELVEKQGARPDVATGAGPGPRGERGLTPLSIAAARGMPSVVKYLVKMGSSLTVAGTGQFRLFTNTSKSIRGTFTPLEFSKKMREAELAAGAQTSDLKELDTCIRVLEKMARP